MHAALLYMSLGQVSADRAVILLRCPPPMGASVNMWAVLCLSLLITAPNWRISRTKSWSSAAVHVKPLPEMVRRSCSSRSNSSSSSVSAWLKYQLLVASVFRCSLNLNLNLNKYSPYAVGMKKQESGKLGKHLVCGVAMRIGKSASKVSL